MKKVLIVVFLIKYYHVKVEYDRKCRLLKLIFFISKENNNII